LGWRYLGDEFFTDLPEDVDFDSAYHAQKKMIFLDANVLPYDKLRYGLSTHYDLLYICLGKSNLDINPYWIFHGRYKDVANYRDTLVDIDMDTL
jgi:hypothetical protein